MKAEDERLLITLLALGTGIGLAALLYLITRSSGSLSNPAPLGDDRVTSAGGLD